jgi:hypothetical protein
VTDPAGPPRPRSRSHPGRRFSVTVVTIPPGGERIFDEREWRDALVILVRGEIALASIDGGYLRLSRGAALWLAGLSLRALQNPGAGVARLVAISRRRADR